METELISTTEAARRLGVAPTSLTNAIKTNRISIYGRDPKNNRVLLMWPNVRDEYVAVATRYGTGQSGNKGDKRRKDSPDAPVLTHAAVVPPEWAAIMPSVAPEIQVVTEPQGENESDGTPQGETMAQSRALGEFYKARREQLEYEKEKNLVVSVEVLRDELFKINRKIRDAFVSLPDRISPRLAVISDPADCHYLLANEVNEILRALAEEMYPGVGKLEGE